MRITCYPSDKLYRNRELKNYLKRICLNGLKNTLLGEERGYAFIARDNNGEIMGWSFCKHAGEWGYDKNNKWRKDDTVRAYKVATYVRPKFRRQGVGSKLIRRAKKLVTFQLKRKLYCDPWNERATAFFTKMGLAKNKMYWCVDERWRATKNKPFGDHD